MLLVKSVISQVSLTHFVKSSPVCRSSTKRDRNVHCKSYYQETKFTEALFAKETMSGPCPVGFCFKDLSSIH